MTTLKYYAFILFGMLALLLVGDASGGNGRDLVTDPTGDMAVPRYYSNLCILGNEEILIVGGRDTAGTKLNAAETYDYKSGIFTATAGDMIDPQWKGFTARFYVSAICEMVNTLTGSGNHIFIGGFGYTEVYNPTTRTFTKIDLLPDQNAPAGPGSVFPNGWDDLC